jgi:hypothetical protein
MTLFLVGLMIGYFVSEGFKAENSDSEQAEKQALKVKVDHLENQVQFHKDANNMLVKRIKGE